MKVAVFVGLIFIGECILASNKVDDGFIMFRLFNASLFVFFFLDDVFGTDDK